MIIVQGVEIWGRILLRTSRPPRGPFGKALLKWGAGIGNLQAYLSSINAVARSANRPVCPFRA
jgi:hypothetical protein